MACIFSCPKGCFLRRITGEGQVLKDKYFTVSSSKGQSFPSGCDSKPGLVRRKKEVKQEEGSSEEGSGEHQVAN